MTGPSYRDVECGTNMQHPGTIRHTEKGRSPGANQHEENDIIY